MNKIKNINFAEFHNSEKISYFKLIINVLNESTAVGLENIKIKLAEALKNYDSVDMDCERLFNNWKNAASIAGAADKNRREIYSSLMKVVDVMSGHCSDETLKSNYAEIKDCFSKSYSGKERQAVVSGYIDNLLKRVANKSEAIENCKLTEDFKKLTDVQNDYNAKVFNRNQAHAEYAVGLNAEAIKACLEAYAVAKTQIEAMQYITGAAEYTKLVNNIDKTARAFALKAAYKREAEEAEAQCENKETE